MKKIPLSQDKFALVDDIDFEWLSDHSSWFFSACGHKNGNGYALSNVDTKGTRYMHRLIMGDPNGKQIDHIDGNGLNNQKSNLRIVKKQQNIWNQGPQFRNKTGLKGVTIAKKYFVARIAYMGITYYIDRFSTAEEAAIAYNSVALQFYGDNAYQNE